MIYFVSEIPGGLLRVPAAGGEPKEFVRTELAKGERQYKYPCALPAGKAILLTVGTADAETFDDAHIIVLNTETGQRKTLVEGGTHPRYSPSGHLLYAHDGKVFAVRFDLKRLETMGQPFLVLEGVLMSRDTGVANYDVSASSGDLVYIPGVEDKGERSLVWVDRNGHAEPLTLPPRPYLHPRICPDTRQLAIEIEGPNHNFYVYDFAREVLSQITTDGVSHWPVWSSDGTELVYRSGPMGEWRMWQVPADRSRPAAQLPGVGLHKTRSPGPRTAMPSPTRRTHRRRARTSWWSRSRGITSPAHSLMSKPPPALPSSRRTAGGWRTVRMKPRRRRFTCKRFRARARKSRCRAMAAPILCGSGTGRSSISETGTR